MRVFAIGRPIGTPGRSASARDVSGRQVTCTVVSVGPYMLTSRGGRAAWRSHQVQRRRSQRLAAEDHVAQRCWSAVLRLRVDDSSEGAGRQRSGRVTPCACRSARGSPAGRAAPVGTITRRPP